MKKRYLSCRKKLSVKNIRAQVWIETVLYTLIAFVMIGLVLAYAKPKIEELQDKTIIEQSIEMLKNIDSTILTIGAPGNQRLIEIGIKKGELKIDGEQDLIVFEMESRHTYSEPGKEVVDGNIKIYTEKKGNDNIVILTRDYDEEYDILYQEEDETGLISKSSTSYKMLISNKGGDPEQINFEFN